VDAAAENWILLAEYDLGAAEEMLRCGRTLYVVFTCQQAAEKGLKGLVAARSGSPPPRTHDLFVLSRLLGSDVPERFTDLLGYLNQSFMAVRYPLDLEEATKTYPDEAVAPLIPETKELLRWIRSALTPSG
jgi:HEPN domain-containing protein